MGTWCDDGSKRSTDGLVAETSRNSSTSSTSSIPSLIDASDTARLLQLRAASASNNNNNNNNNDNDNNNKKNHNNINETAKIIAEPTSSSISDGTRINVQPERGASTPGLPDSRPAIAEESTGAQKEDEEAETMTIRLADLSEGLAREFEALRFDVSEASSLDWTARSTKSAPASAARSLSKSRTPTSHHGFALKRSDQLSAEDIRLYNSFHKATGLGYMSTTELWQRRLSADSSMAGDDERNTKERAASDAKGRNSAASSNSGLSSLARQFSSKLSKLTESRKRHIDSVSEERELRAGPTPDAPKNVELIPAKSRLTRPTVSSASREVSRGEAARLEAARRQKLQQQVSVNEERRYRKLMRKDTASSSGRKRMMRKYSSGPNYARSEEVSAGMYVTDSGSWVSTSEPGPSPESKTQGIPAAHMLSTATEGAQTWGTVWGTRDQIDGVWVGPANDIASPVNKSAWASRDSKCEDTDDDDNAFLYSKPPARTPKLSQGSRKILRSNPDQRRPILEHIRHWPAKQALRQAQAAEAGDLGAHHGSGDPSLERPRTAGHERLAQLRRRADVARRSESAEADSLVSLVATLPDGFRENVVRMIETLPGSVDGQATMLRESLHPAAAENRHWAHSDLVQEHADIHAAASQDDETAKASAREASLDAPAAEGRPPSQQKVVKKAVYRPDAIDSHVERLRDFRKQQELKTQAAERAMVASGWTPASTVQRPFKLSTGSRKSARRSSSSTSSSTSWAPSGKSSKKNGKRVVVAAPRRKRKARSKRSSGRPAAARAVEQPAACEEKHDIEYERVQEAKDDVYESEGEPNQEVDDGCTRGPRHPLVDHRFCSHAHEHYRSPCPHASCHGPYRVEVPAWGRRQTEWLPWRNAASFVPPTASSPICEDRSKDFSPFANLPEEERKFLDEIETELGFSVTPSSAGPLMALRAKVKRPDTAQPELFRCAADIDHFLENSY